MDNILDKIKEYWWVAAILGVLYFLFGRKKYRSRSRRYARRARSFFRRKGRSSFRRKGR